MAKKKGKKGKYKSAKRRAAGKKAYKKTGLYKYNQMRKKGKYKRGKKKKGKGKYKGGKKSYKKHGGMSPRAQKIYAQAILRGRSPAQAHKAAARFDRMMKSKAKRYFEHQGIKAKSAEALSNVFANIGTAGHLAHVAGVH